MIKRSKARAAALLVGAAMAAGALGVPAAQAKFGIQCPKLRGVNCGIQQAGNGATGVVQAPGVVGALKSANGITEGRVSAGGVKQALFNEGDCLELAVRAPLAPVPPLSTPGCKRSN